MAFLSRLSKRPNRAATHKPSLLIVSFSDIYRDTRVLKQIDLFRDSYDITTCGYGHSPRDWVTHLEIPRGESRAIVLVRAALIRAHLYSMAYWITPSVRRAHRELRGRDFDAVIANDLDTAGLAMSVAPADRVHVDLHEYWVGLHDLRSDWVKIRKPYHAWMLRKYVTRAASVTTVSPVISQWYKQGFGFDSEVVPNYSRYHDLEPTEVGEPLRVVHAGGTNPGRHLDVLMRAVAAVDGMTMDMYLLGQGTPYFNTLEDLAQELGDSIRILDPLESADVVPTMNQYDIGLHSLPPTSSNHRGALPNKYYEFIQARLALVLGPSDALKKEAETFDGAIVADDYTWEALADALRSLDRETVARMKQASHRAAPEYVAEYVNPIWQDAVDKIVQARGAANTGRTAPIGSGKATEPGRSASLIGSTENTRPQMIFHTHYPLNPNAKSASGIRPVKMRNAFEAIGYDVIEVTGYHPQRRKIIGELRQQIEKGWRPDFLYSESATYPVGLGEKFTSDTSLNRDMNFLAFCRSHGIPTSLYYRDIYWKFWGWKEVLKSPLKILSSWRYRADLAAYRKALSVLYLQSRELARPLPKVMRERVKTLPPGSSITPSTLPLDGVAIIYVGGLGLHYGMLEAVRTAGAVDGCHMTLCCREEEWAAESYQYQPVLTDSVEIIHASGSELDQYYDRANVASLFVEPTEYRKMVLPVKLFEYLAHGKPVIASEGTLVAKYVAKHKVGWTIPYTQDALTGLIEQLAANPQVILDASDRARTLAEKNTWEQRAQQVVDDMQHVASSSAHSDTRKFPDS